MRSRRVNLMPREAYWREHEECSALTEGKRETTCAHCGRRATVVVGCDDRLCRAIAMESDREAQSPSSCVRLQDGRNVYLGETRRQERFFVRATEPATASDRQWEEHERGLVGVCQNQGRVDHQAESRGSAR